MSSKISAPRLWFHFITAQAETKNHQLRNILKTFMLYGIFFDEE